MWEKAEDGNSKLEVVQSKLSSLSSKKTPQNKTKEKEEEKQTEPMRLVGQHQAHQHMHYVSLKSREEKKACSVINRSISVSSPIKWKWSVLPYCVVMRIK